MSTKTLVTGISGFIGGHVALALLTAGHAVRGSLRDMSRADEVRELLARAGADVGRLDFVRLDLGDADGWREAMAGMRYLVHVASPIGASAPGDRDAMIGPAVAGARHAVSAALAAGVERIVLTSSTAAVAYGHPRERTEPFGEADWTRPDRPDVNAYAESKTRAELEAWSLMEEAGRRADLATINPAVVFGPLLGRDIGVSPQAILRLFGAPAVPRLSFGIVDVRDVAALHVAALTTPGAGGHRFIAAAAPMSTLDLARDLRVAFPGATLPRFALPDWLVRLLALASPELRDLLPNLGPARRFDSAPAERLLGRPLIPPRLAAAATARSLVELGLVRLPDPEKRG